MKGQKKIISFTKNIFRQSLTDDLVDPKKTSRILQLIISQKPAQLVKILKMYKRLIEQKLAKEEIIVESAIKTPNQKKLETYLIKKTGAGRIRYKINPNIVFGVKVIHSDWVYEATLESKLAKLLNK